MSIIKLGKGVAVVVSASMLFACASSGDKDVSELEDPNVGTEQTEQVEQIEQEEQIEEVPAAKSAEELAAEANAAKRQRRTIYFDFDDDAVSFEARELLEAHAEFLSKPENAGLVVVIEGHCDERGTPAYNLALGERRAKSIAHVLMLNGVSASQIKNVSYGEEKPAKFGHDERAWSKNRRGVLVYEG